MKTVKSLLLGSAAGFVALTGAQAADLPMAEPVEYVKVCSTYGEGFFYIPGTDTCLQISGKVRVDGYINIGETGDDLLTDDGDDDYGTRSRGVVAFDVRSETEWGTLRAFLELEGNEDGGSNGATGNGAYDDGAFDMYWENAFIQFAGVTAGYTASFYDFVEYDFIGDFFSDEQVNTIAYTASFGSGFAATIAVEDKYFRGEFDDPGAGILGVSPDQNWPNIVAALRVDQAWGAAQVSGAVQDNEGDVLAGFPNDIGWAVQAGVKLNVPFAEEGSFVWAQGAYSEGATSYAGSEDMIGGTGGLGLTQLGTDDLFGELWHVGGGIHIQATETVRLALGASYAEYNEAGPNFDYSLINVEGDIFWTPVDNLDLGIGVLYSQIDDAVTLVTDPLTGAIITPGQAPENGADSVLQIVTRIERSF